MEQPIRRYGVPASSSSWDSVDHLLDEWARERPDLDFTPLGIVYRLGRVRRLLEQRMAEVYAKHGLTAADFLVVVTLRRSGAPYRMPQARLTDALGLTSGTVSLRLDRLAKAGVVTRAPDPDDRRGSIITLAADGLRLFDSIAPEHLANEDRLLSALTGEQRGTLADLLRHLLISLEPDSTTRTHLGLTVESAITARRMRSAVGLSDTPGLLVSDVEAGTPAEAAGLQRGDLLVDIDGRPLHSAATLADIIAARGDDEPIEVALLRGDEAHRATLRTSV